jgi:GNAT superfamily N-acetyltransferase
MVAIAEIRCAEPSERRALGALHRRSSYVWEEDRALLDRHPEVFGVAAEAIAEGRVRVAVDAEGELLGFATVVERSDGACELEGLVVEPEAMRGGVGRALVADACARAVRAGQARMTVVAAARTVPFYERLGFVVGGVVQTRFAPAVRLWRELSLPPRAS